MGLALVLLGGEGFGEEGGKWEAFVESNKVQGRLRVQVPALVLFLCRFGKSIDFSDGGRKGLKQVLRRSHLRRFTYYSLK